MAFVGRAVVGHDALDGDAVGREPSQTALEERDGIFLALAREQLGEGQARSVIDGDKEVFPTEPLAFAIAGDAVADAVDA